MEADREKLTDIFARLGDELASFGETPETKRVITCAAVQNPWFTRGDIMRSVRAIRTQMLDRRKLEAWLAAYPALPARKPKNVGVIMAGNIPLVGFFDLLCVLISGHACHYKTSSKDNVLISYIVSTLRQIWPGTPAYIYIGQPLDAVIATGGNNAVRHFRSMYGGLPSVFRGNRASAAVLTGDETHEELRGLGDDIFSYSGLGCRNVSHLLLPEGYKPEKFLADLNYHTLPNNKYLHNFLQRSAVLRMQGIPFTDDVFFMLREDDDFPTAISEITYNYYRTPGEAGGWIASRCNEIQCVVSRGEGRVPFGQSQSPALTDYPDGVDTMAFLASL